MSEDNGMDVSPSWEQLKSERDHYKALAESRWDGAIEANQRADALAAHVEVLSSIINGSDLTDRPHVMSALNSIPGTSLAPLKAQWQAEALEEQAEAYAQQQTLRVSMELQDAADEKRRQAEDHQ